MEVICGRYQMRLQGYVRRLAADAPVEEITQDVFLRFWATASGFDVERGTLSAYLHAIARGKTVDWRRAETARRDREHRYASRLTDDGSDRSEVASIRSAVEALPLPELKAVWLAYYLGFTYRQVASILDIPEGTTKAHIKRALHRLRRPLDSLGEGQPAGNLAVSAQGQSRLPKEA